MEWMLLPLKRYAVFEGRAGRREFWMYTAMLTVAWIVVYVGIVASLAPYDRSRVGPYSQAFLLWLLAFALLYWATFLPGLALQVRRLHDQDQSGWLVLLAFIPCVGWLVMLVFMCIEGTRGPNQFGVDPKEPDGEYGTVSHGPQQRSDPLPRRPDLM